MTINNMKKKGLFIAGCMSLMLGVSAMAMARCPSPFAESGVAVEAATPSSYAKVYRFTAPASSYWGTTYVHAWGSETAENNTTWPGFNLSNEYSYNESGRKVYTFATNVTDYKYLIFHNNADWQTKDIEIGDNVAWYLDDGTEPGTWTPENQTYYLYDYQNMFAGEPKCYAWQSNGSLYNEAYPGVGMTKLQYGSGQLYSVTLDPAYDMVKFGVGDSANTGDHWCNQNRGETFCWWDVGDGDWNNDLDWVKAHDWVYNTMHVRDISQETTTDTGACKGNTGYYQKAKAAYQSFTQAIKTKIHEDACWDVAKTRFMAWADANKETVTFVDGDFVFNAYNIPTYLNSNETNPFMIIVVASVALISVASVATIIVIKRKRAIR